MKFNRKRRYYGYDYNDKHSFFFTDTTMHHVERGDKLRAMK